MRRVLPAVRSDATNDGDLTNMGWLAHAPSGGWSARANGLLASLAAADLRLLEPIELVRLTTRYTLFEAAAPLKHLYFPASGVVSFVQPDKRGATPEIAQIGAEGVVGVVALFGAERAQYRAVVQIPGEAYRVSVFSARRAFAASQTFQAVVLRFAELLIRQLAQNVVCKLSHSVEQQFCQRLLLYAERLAGGALEMTHEQIAEMLGSRRQGVTETARRLQAQKVIACSRGRIAVLDPSALERYACECYRVLRDAYRLVSAPASPSLPG